MTYFEWSASAGLSTEEEEAECGLIIGMAVEGSCSLLGWQQYILVKVELYLK